MAKLGEIFDLQMGKTPSRNQSDYWTDGQYSWVSIADLGTYQKYVGTTKENISEVAVRESGIKSVPANTVIMSFKLSLGKTAITQAPVYTNEAIMAFIPTGKYEILPDYFYHLFSAKDWTKGTNRAVMGTTLNKATLGSISVTVPSIDEQRKIAAVLDKVSDLIAKRRQQLDKLDLLVKARFVEMFGECKTNPKNWDICNLEEVAQVGSSKRVFVEELQESGIPFYRGTEVGSLAEGKNIKPELFITEDHYMELCKATGKPQIGDLLMPSICPDGRIWIVNSEAPFYFKDGRVLWVHDINKDFNSVFLLYTLKDRIMSDYTSIASGTTFAELKIFSLKQCKIFIVPIELQNEFAAFVGQTEKTKTTIICSLEKLETLKKALMQEYFEKGEI